MTDAVPLSSRVRKRSAHVAAAALVVVLAGALWTSQYTRTTVQRHDGVRILVSGHDDPWRPLLHPDVAYAHMGVGIIGTVGRLDSGCIGFGGPSDPDRSVIVWPPGSKLRSRHGSPEIVYKGKVARIGDGIVAGGNDDPVGILPERQARFIRARCGEVDTVVVLDEIEKVGPGVQKP